MRYWLLTTEFPPLSGGGISTYCLHTVRMLQQFGHDVTVLVCDNSASNQTTDESFGCKCIRIPLKQQHSAYLGDETAWSLTLSNALDELAESAGEPDVIEAQEYNGIAYLPLQKKLLLKGKFANTKFIVTAHAPSFLYLEYNQGPTHEVPYYWTGEMEKSVLLSADGVISPSQYLLDKLEGYISWKNQQKIAVKNPYAFEETEIPEYTEGEIVFFGKLTPQKGCLEMMEYFSKAWDAGINCRLKVIGGGDHFFYPRMSSMVSYLEKRYGKYIASGHLTFTGHINPDKLHAHLNSAHAVLVPSIVDNLPYTVVESMAAGKIVLASTSGGQEELINNGKDGFLFTHDATGDSFTAQLKTILALSASEVNQIGAQAVSKIRDICGYANVYARKMAFIDQVSAGPRDHFPFTRVNSEHVNTSSKGNGVISVVIPYYNLGEYIDETIASIRQSDYKNHEIVIVNDGSDSVHEEKLQKYVRDSDITICTIPNNGLSNARNVGAQQATGEFLAFLDADDCVEPSYYSKAIDILTQYSNVHFVGCWAEYFQDSRISWPAFNPEPPYLLVHNMINTSGLVYRKDKFVEHGRNDPQFTYGMEDYDSLVSLVSSGHGGVAIPEKLWKYRIRKESMAQAFNKYSKEFLYRLLVRKHAGFYSEHAAEVTNLLNANGPGYLIENPTRVTRKQIKYMHPAVIKYLKQNKLLRPIALKVYAYLNK